MAENTGSEPRAELSDAKITVAFLLAGNAHVTFQSKQTGLRFTYRVRAATPGFGSRVSHFVALLTAPDHYSYMGCIFERRFYTHGKKSRVSTNAMSAIAFSWVWRHLSAGTMPKDLAIWHEGRCGMCGRRLTTPESISTGLGPVCASRQS